MKKIKLLTPILGLSTMAGVIAPITSCGQKEKDPEDVKPTKITVEPDSVSMATGECKQLSVRVEPEGASQKVVWKSDDTDVAFVGDNNMLYARNPGTATITVSPEGYDDITTTCNVEVTETYFTCEEPEQETVRGQTACWYIFDYAGTDTTPSDIAIDLHEHVDGLNDQVLYQFIGDKKIQVGIQGKRDVLKDLDEKEFTLDFKSETLGIDEQSEICKYTYLESKISAVSPKVEERDDTITDFVVDAQFALTNPSDYDEALLSATLVNIRKSDPDNIGDPELGQMGYEDVEKRVHQEITVEKKSAWTDGDWIQFDIEVSYTGEKPWTQTITNYTYQVLDINYTEDNIDTACKIQIDVKGNEQDGLKAWDGTPEEGKGILPKNTPISSPFRLKFEAENTPQSWIDDNLRFYKFGSFVDPTKYSSGYYHYSSIIVKVIKKDTTEEALTQTYTGDRAGDAGYWWVSTGGPITVIKERLDTDYEGWIGLVFEIRTGQTIEHDSSFYLTYAVN